MPRFAPFVYHLYKFSGGGPPNPPFFSRALRVRYHTHYSIHSICDHNIYVAWCFSVMCARLRVRVGWGEGGAVFYILRGGAVILRYASAPGLGFTQPGEVEQEKQVQIYK